MAYDPRTIANLILTRAKTVGVRVTNFSLNKIIYFLHGHYIAKCSSPLIKERFEAWKHGPVLCTIYNCFKKYGDKPIETLAERMDFHVGKMVPVQEIISDQDYEIIEQYIDIYTRASVSQLYEWSHVKDGPWDKAWNYQTLSNPGMLISDHEIANHFRKEKALHGGFRA